MVSRMLLACAALLLLSLHLPQSSAQQQPRLPNLFRRSRLAARSHPAQGGTPVPAPAAAAAPAVPASQPSTTSSSNSSRSSGRCGSAGWPLAVIGAERGSSSSSSNSSSEPPASTDRVLICLISSGVHKDAAGLSHNRWTGCVAQDPLDPTGCTLPWAPSPSAPGFRPRGTWAAALMAAKEGGLIPGGADIHVVPVDGPASGSLDPGSLAPHGKSRLRAYSVCEGRLRGLQAADWPGNGRPRWRMVMLVDVAANKPTAVGSGEFALSEGDWVAAATGPGPAEGLHMPDVLIVAPAGQKEAVGYPAALPTVIGVGASKCNGDAAQAYLTSGAGKPDLLAPGVNVPVPGADKPWSDSTAAAALVAGAAARLWSAFPRCGANAIRGALVGGGTGKDGPARLSLPAAEAALKKLRCATTQS